MRYAAALFLFIVIAPSPLSLAAAPVSELLSVVIWWTLDMTWFRSRDAGQSGTTLHSTLSRWI